MVSEDGPTAVEYAVLLGLIVVVSFGAIGGIGVLIANVYNAINDALPS
jgi:pilus assembly protein Flp/PilA